MAIQGSLSIETLQQTDRINVLHDAAVTLEALTILGALGDDPETKLATITEDYASIVAQTAAADITGELYVDVTYEQISTAGMVEAIDDHFGVNYPQTYVYHDLWTPGTTRNSYTEAELSKTSAGVRIARMALRNTDNTADSLLHFYGQPLDDYAREKWGGGITQIESIALAKAAFEKNNPGLTMSSLGYRALMLIAIQRRIKGESMPIIRGLMLDPALPRALMGDHFRASEISSNSASQLQLNRSPGTAGSCNGVGLSLGLTGS